MYSTYNLVIKVRIDSYFIISCETGILTNGVIKCFLIKVRYSDDKLIFSNGISNFFFNNFHMLFCFLLSSSLNNIPDNIKSSEDAHSFLKFVLIICTSADTSSLYFNY